MSTKYRRKKSTKHFKIKVVQDVSGDYWDVYEQRITANQIHIYRGWQYGCTPADEGISPVFTYILTQDLAELIKANPIQSVHDQTGLSLSIIGRMRLILGINRNFVYRNDEWILANQIPLLKESYKTLKELFNLTKPQVNQHRIWLNELLSISKSKRLRNTNHDDKISQWFAKEYDNFKGLTVQNLMEKYQLSKYVAIKVHDKYQCMNGGLTYSEILEKQKIEQAKWLIDNKNILISSTSSVVEIAKNLNKSSSQIIRLRKKLKQLLIKNSGMEIIKNH